MSAQATQLSWDVMRSLASASISGSYAALGTPLTYPARLVKIINATTEDVTISIDGVNDHDFVVSAGAFIYDCGTNKGSSSNVLEIPKGTQFFVKGTAGDGAVYLVALYGNVPATTLPGVI